MARLPFLLLFVSLFFADMPLAFAQTETFLPPKSSSIKSTDPIPKMVWAHYCAWGFQFDKLYDTPGSVLMRLYDKPLLGKGRANSDGGTSSTTRNEIESAILHGIEGFTVDIPSSHAYASSMTRFYQAAEGLPFCISLSVDGWNAGPIDTIVEHLTAYFDRWGKHPNNFYIDGKPVVFIYSPRGKTPDECATIIEKLKHRGHEAFWLIQPFGEDRMWNDPKKLARMLEIFDGFYDFGHTGIPQEQRRKILSGAHDALVAAGRPNGGLLVGGITQGYSGGHNAFYRPFFGTRTLRDSWEAALAEKCAWVGITTWNDYWESTQFGPSDWVRESLLRINTEYVRRWRNENPPARPPQVFAAYKNEVRLGDDWTFEIMSFPYSTAEAVCRTRLLDLSGEPIREFDPVPLSRDKQDIVTHRLIQPGFEKPRTFRLQAVVVEKNAEPDEKDWKELYPLVIRPGIVRDYQTLRIALAETMPQETPQLKVIEEKDRLVFRTNIEAWSWIGKAELLCNGKPVESKEVRAENRGPRKAVEFVCSPIVPRQPRDLYVIRFTRLDGRYGWSSPVVVRHSKDGDQVEIPVLARNGDFDECWMERPSPERKTATIDADELYGFSFSFDDNPSTPKDGFGWNIAAAGGGRRGDPDPEAVPKLDGEHFAFDGKNDRIMLQAAALPHDVISLEATIRPREHHEDGYVFSDQNRALALGIQPDGKVFAERDGKIFMRRLQTRVVSDHPIPFGEWSTVVAVYDGISLTLFINGKQVGQVPCLPAVFDIGSFPTVGSKHKMHLEFSHPFHGDIKGLRAVAAPWTPDDWKR